jgi:hypothetical protein
MSNKSGLHNLIIARLAIAMACSFIPANISLMKRLTKGGASGAVQIAY